MSHRIAALIATFRRPHELARLLESLAVPGHELAAIVVVDNEGSTAVRTLVESTPRAHYLPAGGNLGCGGGLRLAAERALSLPTLALTHLLILDDDAVVPPGALSALADAAQHGHAALAYPLVTDAEGRVGWLPGWKQRAANPGNVFAGTSEQFRQKFGVAAREIIWAQGICLLIQREAFERCGPHRDDFWVRGEDLEFSLRLTASDRGLFVPSVTVQHLPPPESNVLSREGEYLKHCAMLQNIAYLGCRLPHGRRIAWTFAGALRRFLRLWTWGACADAGRAFWRGAVLGEPAGRGAGRTFRARFMDLSGKS